MSEEEIQQAFREQVLAELEGERVALGSLTDRVAKLEQTVVHGNGHPALTVQVKELETKVDSLGKDVASLKEGVAKIGALNDCLVEIKTTLALQRNTSANWWGVFLVILTVVGTALAQRYLGG